MGLFIFGFITNEWFKTEQQTTYVSLGFFFILWFHKNRNEQRRWDCCSDSHTVARVEYKAAAPEAEVMSLCACKLCTVWGNESRPEWVSGCQYKTANVNGLEREARDADCSHFCGVSLKQFSAIRLRVVFLTVSCRVMLRSHLRR